MALEGITMPQLGESVTEGTITTWLVQAGDKVNKYDPIAEVMTDKVNAEIPSSFSGIVKELIVGEGDTIAVGEIMCHIETVSTTNEIDRETASSKKESNNALPKQAEHQSEEVKQPSMKNRYSPAVLRMAQENDIELTSVSGSGRGGRITRKDIEKIISTGASPKTSSQEAVENEKPQKQQFQQTDGIEIPVTGVRKAIAQKMVMSKQEIPHAWMTVEVDVTNLVNLRNAVKDEFKKKEGYNLTFFTFFVKAVAQALKEYPELNSTWAEDKIIQHKDINISIAVASERELFVPVIKRTDDKTIKGIARDIFELAQKARNGKLSSADMSGGTFTVNNTGSFGSINSMGVINHPQAAILQVESIVKRPVIIDNMFAARDMVNLSLSLDHRVLDGLICGLFMARVKEILENINEANTPIY